MITGVSPLSDKVRTEERQASEALLRFLQAKLDSLSLEGKQVLYKQLTDVVDGTLLSANKKLSRMTDLVLKNPSEGITIKWGMHSTEDAFQTLNKSGIEWGRAGGESKTITLLSVISFAPKEIIREVVVHEALHIIYRMLDPSCIAGGLAPSHITSAVSEYPADHQQEELWVRTMTKRLGFDERTLPLWEIAVEQGGEAWRPLYYQLKKNRKRLQ